MAAEPLVSIMVPTYGRAAMLREAVESALAQDWERLEVVVLDDASPDETAEVVEELAARDGRVRLVRREQNVGSLANGIDAFRQARGEYVKLLLDDDLLEPHHVRALVEPLVAEPSLALAFSRRRMIDADGRELEGGGATAALAERAGVVDGRTLATTMLAHQRNLVGEHSTVLIPRWRLDPAMIARFAGAEVTHVLTDLAMWVDLLARGNAWYTPEVTSAFRVHEGQVSGRRDEVEAGSWCDYEVMLSRAPAWGLLREPAARLDAMARLAQLAARTAQGAGDAVQRERAAGVLERVHARGAHLQRAAAIEDEDDPAREQELAAVRDLPTVAVAVAASGAVADTFRLLQQLGETLPNDGTMVDVVADAPTEDHGELLAALAGSVRTEALDERAGELAAWERAVERASEDVVVLARAGAVPGHGWLGPLLEALAGDGVVAAGGLLQRAPGAAGLHHAGYVLDDDGRPVPRPIPADPVAAGWPLHESADVAAPAPGLLALRRDAWPGAAAVQEVLDRARDAGDEMQVETAVALAIGERAPAGTAVVRLAPACVTYA